MKRYARYNQIGSGVDMDAWRPDWPAGSQGNVLSVRAGLCFVKMDVPDGTPKDAATIADMAADRSEVLVEGLTLAQRTALRNWVQANHPAWLNALDSWTDDDGDGLVGIRNRRRYLKLIARIFGFGPGEWRTVLHGYDVNP